VDHGDGDDSDEDNNNNNDDVLITKCLFASGTRTTWL
jgi:hypothetical protein